MSYLETGEGVARIIFSRKYSTKAHMASQKFIFAI